MRMLGVALAALVTMSTAACGGNSKDENGAASTAPATASATAASGMTPTPSPGTPGGAGAASPGEDTVVYHDAVAGNDVTVKMLREVIAQMPKALSCQDMLTGGKTLGNEYPNGEDLYMRICKEVPRK